MERSGQGGSGLLVKACYVSRKLIQAATNQNGTRILLHYRAFFAMHSISTRCAGQRARLDRGAGRKRRREERRVHLVHRAKSLMSRRYTLHLMT